MAQQADLQKLTLPQLKEFAGQNGVSDADNYKSKEELAKVLSPKVTPEQLAEYRTTIDGIEDNDTPNTPGDDDADDTVTGDPQGEEMPADNEGDTVLNSQAPENTDDADDKDDDEAKPGGENGQADNPDKPVEVKSVQLENPGGRVVDVPVETVMHQNLFAQGFKKVKGQSYDKEITDLEEQTQADIKARGSYSDVDQSDPLQPMSVGDIERRKGTKKTGDREGEITNPLNPGTSRVANETGQTHNPQNNKPKKGTTPASRIARALKK